MNQGMGEHIQTTVAGYRETIGIVPYFRASHSRSVTSPRPKGKRKKEKGTGKINYPNSLSSLHLISYLDTPLAEPSWKKGKGTQKDHYEGSGGKIEMTGEGI